MHTFAQNGVMWTVYFVPPYAVTMGDWIGIADYTTTEQAMDYVSFLNGGLPPNGYTMGVITTS